VFVHNQIVASLFHVHPNIAAYFFGSRRNLTGFESLT
jgi:hypothetical protein